MEVGCWLCDKHQWALVVLESRQRERLYLTVSKLGVAGSGFPMLFYEISCVLGGYNAYVFAADPVNIRLTRPLVTSAR